MSKFKDIHVEILVLLISNCIVTGQSIRDPFLYLGYSINDALLTTLVSGILYEYTECLTVLSKRWLFLRGFTFDMLNLYYHAPKDSERLSVGLFVFFGMERIKNIANKKY